jgi:Ca2+-binding RTX toxin-like protein
MPNFYGSDIDDIVVGGFTAYYPGYGNDHIFGDASSEVMYGGDGDDQLISGAGDDYLDGGRGNDLLDGGAGDDLLIGGDGKDIYIVDGFSDVVREAAGGGVDTVLATNSFSLRSREDIEILRTADATGASTMDLFGNDVGQRVTGNAGANVMNGFGGTDRLNGLAGNDRLIGGADDDYLDGGAGDDVVIGGWAGQGGIDFMRGGAGNDTFVFDVRASFGNLGRISDFSRVSDTIQLDPIAFRGVHGVLDPMPGEFRSRLLDPDAFVVGRKALDAEDRIIYDRTTGNLFYDVDGSGGEAAVKFAVLLNKPAILSTDFVIGFLT